MAKIKKEKVGRIFIYTIPLEIDGVNFSILLSRPQLVKISKTSDRCMIRVDIEKQDDLCNQLSPKYKLPCTRPKGHKGNHEHFPWVWANENGSIFQKVSVNRSQT